jgi:excinuclease ABC subunit A
MRARGVARGFHFRSTLLEVDDRGITLQTVLTLSATEASTTEAGRFFARSPRLARALERLTTLGLSAIPLGAFLWQLTYGQRQRLRLAALTAEPAGALYLIDEPLSGLTERERGETLHFLTGVVESGATVLYSAHETGEIAPKKARKQR